MKNLREVVRASVMLNLRNLSVMGIFAPVRSRLLMS